MPHDQSTGPGHEQQGYFRTSTQHTKTDQRGRHPSLNFSPKPDRNKIRTQFCRIIFPNATLRYDRTDMNEKIHICVSKVVYIYIFRHGCADCSDRDESQQHSGANFWHIPSPRTMKDSHQLRSVRSGLQLFDPNNRLKEGQDDKSGDLRHKDSTFLLTRLRHPSQIASTAI